MSALDRSLAEERALINEAVVRFGGPPQTMIEAIEFDTLKKEIWAEWQAKKKK